MKIEPQLTVKEQLSRLKKPKKKPSSINDPEATLIFQTTS